MSNIETVNELITAINFDRFAEIEAHHAPDVVFASFRGPTLRDSLSVGDWHRDFLRDYADCNYSDLEYIEQDDVVVVRATIEAKGYDWRPFTQRIVEVFRVTGGEVVERRLYGMLRDIEFDKPTNAAMEDALGFRGGSASQTRQVVQALYAGGETADAQLHEKVAVVDGVYGLVQGVTGLKDLLAAIPRPAFGVERVTNLFAGDHTALAEVGFDPTRPRVADWHRLVDGKVRVIERYWMLREIGMRPDENYARDRHQRQVILPI
jgi:SnoaL-like domain